MAWSVAYGVQFDAGDVRELAVQLEGVPASSEATFKKIVKDDARQLRNLWRSNAKATARAHGKWYPGRIHDHLSGLSAEIMPEGRPQGFMSFEYGSRNQPPHMDGNRAADVIFPKFVRDVSAAAGDALD